MLEFRDWIKSDNVILHTFPCFARIGAPELWCYDCPRIDKGKVVIVRNLEELIDTERDVRGPVWSSRRFLLAEDGGLRPLIWAAGAF